MATPAQINANRANAQNSTGPRSAEGKSVSRFNALKHGLDAESIVIPGEDPAAFETLAAEYNAEYRPQFPSEFFHLDTMLRADWLKSRLQRVETDLHRTLLAENPGATLAAALLTESPTAKLLGRVQRQIAAHERTWLRARTALHRQRHESHGAEERAFDRYLDVLCARPDPAQLASLRPPEYRDDPPVPTAAATPVSTPAWPPIDEETGQPAYFVG